MVKMADVQIGQSDVGSPKWYHCGTMSVILHGIMLTLCYYWIPDSPLIESLPQSTNIVQVIPVIESLYEDSVESSPEAVPANANPFEEPDEPDVPQPQINLNAPKEEAIQDSELQQAAIFPISPELTAEQDVPEQRDENTKEIHIDVPQKAEDVGGGILSETAKPGNENNAGTRTNDDSSNAFGRNNAEHPGNSKTANFIDESALWEAYKKKLNAHFKSHRHYPEMARRLKLTGNVIVSVEIRKNGEVLSAHVEQSSGIEILDEAAISSAKAASPVPAFPEGVMAQAQTVLIPYRYSLN
ncbi:MAG: energy transducer TonB [Proteobacteria bacterium]|nr:energy transducer TonB [Pseudomonadota bacterium]